MRTLGATEYQIQYANCDTHGDAYEPNRRLFEKRLGIARDDEGTYQDHCLKYGDNCWVEMYDPPHLKCRKKGVRDNVILSNDETLDDDVITHFCPPKFTFEYETTMYNAFRIAGVDAFKRIRAEYIQFRVDIISRNTTTSPFQWVPTYNGSLESIKPVTDRGSILAELDDIPAQMSAFAYNAARRLDMVDACDVLYRSCRWVATNVQNFSTDFVLFMPSGTKQKRRNILDYIAQHKKDFQERGTCAWGGNDADVFGQYYDRFGAYVNGDDVDVCTDQIHIFTEPGEINDDLVVFTLWGLVFNTHDLTDLTSFLTTTPAFLYWTKTLVHDALKRGADATERAHAAQISVVFVLCHEIGHNYHAMTIDSKHELFTIANIVTQCATSNCTGLYSTYKKPSKDAPIKEHVKKVDSFFAEIVAETFGLMCLEFFLRQNCEQDESVELFRFFFLALCGSPSDPFHLSSQSRIKLLKTNTFLYRLYLELRKRPMYFRH